MPRIVDCIKSESETPANVIRLVKVSGGFLRAYNRSAWKFHTFINDYKVKRMFVKSANEEVVSLGFPETSLHTLTDGRQMTTTDLGFDLMLKPGETLRADDYEINLTREKHPLLLRARKMTVEVKVTLRMLCDMHQIAQGVYLQLSTQAESISKQFTAWDNSLFGRQDTSGGG